MTSSTKTSSIMTTPAIMITPAIVTTPSIEIPVPTEPARPAAMAADPATRQAQSPDGVAQRRREAASRAVAEAEARRAQIDERAKLAAKEGERLGRGGLDPVRYGDWEVKGITTDF
ncbi:Protein of unknown function [Rhizobiales bacterium GAS113]|nr:Protein of unknown function [Rhizobiales bacterium GAS113]